MIYNVDKIRTFVIKSFCQTSSRSRFEVQKRCVTYMNIEYTGHIVGEGGTIQIFRLVIMRSMGEKTQIALPTASQPP